QLSRGAGDLQSHDQQGDREAEDGVAQALQTGDLAAAPTEFVPRGRGVTIDELLTQHEDLLPAVSAAERRSPPGRSGTPPPRRRAAGHRWRRGRTRSVASSAGHPPG